MTDTASSETHVTLDLSDVHKSLRELWSSEALRDLPVVRAETHNTIMCRVKVEQRKLPIF